MAHVAALPGNPYDGHTLGKMIPAITEQIGVSLARVYADAGYRGHNAPPAQARLSTSRGRNAASPTNQARVAAPSGSRTGHRPSQGEASDGTQPPGRRAGDAINTLMAAVGDTFRRLVPWLVTLLRALRAIMLRAADTEPIPIQA